MYTDIELSKLPITLSYLLKEAQSIGLNVEKLENSEYSYLHDITDLKMKKSLLVRKTNRYPDLTDEVFALTKHKQRASEFLTKHRINTPRSHLFYSVDEALGLWNKSFHNQTVVIKPEDSGLGKGVFVGLDTESQVVEAVTEVLHNYSQTGLIQSYVSGVDVRIQAVGGKLFAACLRLPAHVIGDGRATIQELIDEKNKEKIFYNPQNNIKINQETLDLLKEQRVTLSTRLKKNKKCLLHKAANIGLGGDAVDVTDTLDVSFRELIENIAKLINMKVFAVDMITQVDFEKIAYARTKDSSVIEINAPCMWAHHHFAVGQKRNVALAIIDNYLYPERFDVYDKKYLL